LVLFLFDRTSYIAPSRVILILTKKLINT